MPSVAPSVSMPMSVAPSVMPTSSTPPPAAASARPEIKAFVTQRALASPSVASVTARLAARVTAAGLPLNMCFTVILITQVTFFARSYLSGTESVVHAYVTVISLVATELYLLLLFFASEGRCETVICCIIVLRYCLLSVGVSMRLFHTNFIFAPNH